MMVSEISETTAAVSEQNGLEHFSKAKFRVKMVSEISKTIGPESQTAHDLPDNLQNLHFPFLSNNLVSETSETSLNQNYGFLNFLRKLKCIRHIKKRIVESMVATSTRCVFYFFSVFIKLTQRCVCSHRK